MQLVMPLLLDQNVTVNVMLPYISPVADPEPATEVRRIPSKYYYFYKIAFFTTYAPP
jgi:hypothetical protein